MDGEASANNNPVLNTILDKLQKLDKSDNLEKQMSYIKRSRTIQQ